MVSQHLRRNAVAYVALFFALAGTAAALPGKNSVDSGDVENGAIRSRDIEDQGILGKDVGNETLTGADIADRGLTGAEIETGSLTGADVTDESLSGADVDGLEGSDIANGGLSAADIGDESLTGADVANGGLTGADLSDESLTGADVTNGGLTGADIDEASLNGLQAAPSVSSVAGIGNLPGPASCGGGTGGLDGLGPSVNVNVSSNRLIAVYAEATMSVGTGEAQVWVAENGNCLAQVMEHSGVTPTTRYTVPGSAAGSPNPGGWIVLRTSGSGQRNIGLRYANTGGSGSADFSDRFLAVVPY